MLPKKLFNFNVYIDGYGFAGIAEEITLPKFERKMEDYDAAGMGGPVSIDMGLEALKLEFTLAEFSETVLRRFGIADASGIGARFLGALIPDDGRVSSALELSVRGRWKSIDLGNAKKKDLTKMKVEMPLTYICLRIDGEAIVEIDLIAGTEVVNGINRVAEVLKALGLVA